LTILVSNSELYTAQKQRHSLTETYALRSD